MTEDPGTRNDAIDVLVRALEAMTKHATRVEKENEALRALLNQSPALSLSTATSETPRAATRLA
jgi:phage terminase large subunit GpA-like protein